MLSLPSDNVVFSKLGCINCDRVITFLTEYDIEYNVVKCDVLLATDREGFLRSMTELTGGITPKVFPMVFIDKKYIGGFREAVEHIEKGI
jgi:glutaredoxin